MFLVLLSVELYSTFRASSAQPSLVHFRVSQSSTLQIGAQRGAEAPRTFNVAVLPIAQQRISSRLPVGDDTIVTGTSVSCLSDPSSRRKKSRFSSWDLSSFSTHRVLSIISLFSSAAPRRSSRFFSCKTSSAASTSEIGLLFLLVDVALGSMSSSHLQVTVTFRAACFLYAAVMQSSASFSLVAIFHACFWTLSSRVSERA